MNPTHTTELNTLLKNIDDVFVLYDKINQAKNDYFVNLHTRVDDDVYNAWQQEILSKIPLIMGQFALIDELRPELLSDPSVKEKLELLSNILDAVHTVGSDIGLGNSRSKEEPVTPELYIHFRPMLSLSNAYHIEDLKRLKEYEGQDPRFCLEPKHDGVAVEMVYTPEGKLSYACTRGDGRQGQRIEGNITNIQGVVQTIYPAEGQEAPPRAVYGEVVFLKAFFTPINNERVKRGLNPYTTLRSAAAGLLRTLEELGDDISPLMFIPYEVSYEPEHIPEYLDVIVWFVKNGFIQTDRQVIVGLDSVETSIKHMERLRDSLGHLTDGLVIKNNLREDLSTRSNYPLRSMAYKFQAPSAVSVLKDVDWSVARTGRQVPTAVLTPVSIRGQHYGRSYLYNMEKIRELKLGFGDEVMVELRGDTIPKITRVIVSNGQGYTPIQPPIFCVACGGDIIDVRNEPFCTFRTKCTGALREGLKVDLKKLKAGTVSKEVLDELVVATASMDRPDILVLAEKEEVCKTLSPKAQTLLSKLRIGVTRSN